MLLRRELSPKIALIKKGIATGEQQQLAMLGVRENIAPITKGIATSRPYPLLVSKSWSEDSPD